MFSAYIHIFLNNYPVHVHAKGELLLLTYSFKVCSALESSFESNLQDRFSSLAICRRIS